MNKAKAGIHPKRETKISHRSGLKSCSNVIAVATAIAPFLLIKHAIKTRQQYYHWLGFNPHRRMCLLCKYIYMKHVFVVSPNFDFSSGSLCPVTWQVKRSAAQPLGCTASELLVRIFIYVHMLHATPYAVEMNFR